MGENRVAIVTGASQGIGFSIAESLLDKGIKVAFASLGIHVLSEPMSAKVKQGSALLIETDVTRDEEIRRCVELVISVWGRIDILVNNAGIRTQTNVSDMTRAEWERVLAVNLGGSFFFSQAVLPIMAEQGYGRIIMMSSIAGQQGSLASSSAYCASKAGQIALTKQLAKQYAAYGITVNAVAPAAIETPDVDQLGDEEKTRMVRSIPVGRWGRPSEVAELVSYLVSEQGGFVTGATFDVNGGLSMR